MDATSFFAAGPSPSVIWLPVAPSLSAHELAESGPWARLLDAYPDLADVDWHIRSTGLPEGDPRYWPEYVVWSGWLRRIVPAGADRDAAHDHLLRLYERIAVEVGP